MVQDVEQMMGRGDWNGAYNECSQLVAQNPSNPKLHAYLGLCLYRRQNFGDAAVSFRKALLLDDTYWEAALKLAQCLDRLMKYEEALEAARVARNLRPSDPTINVLLNGLERQVPQQATDGWQKTTVRHNVKISSE